MEKSRWSKVEVWEEVLGEEVTAELEESGEEESKEVRAVVVRAMVESEEESEEVRAVAVVEESGGKGHGHGGGVQRGSRQDQQRAGSFRTRDQAGPGIWHCRCGYENCSWRLACNSCQAPKPGNIFVWINLPLITILTYATEVFGPDLGCRGSQRIWS